MRTMLSIACLCLCLLFATQAQAKTAGSVVSITPPAWILHNGTKKTADKGSVVEAGDTVIIGDSGHMRIWLKDGTALELAAGTEFEIEDYDAESDEPVFKSRMIGVARMVTGDVAKKNPEGTKLRTPTSTIGIRGTTLTVEAMKSVTTVFVEASAKGVVMDGLMISAGNKGVSSMTGKPSVAPMDGADRARIGQMFPPSQARMPQHGNPPDGRGMNPQPSGARPSQESMSGQPPRDGMAGMPQPLNPDAMRMQDLSRMAQQGIMPHDMPSADLGHDAALSSAAHVHGDLRSTGSVAPTGSFDFDVNLRSGAITDGNMRGSDFNLGGGTGQIHGNAFGVDGFSGTHQGLPATGAMENGVIIRGPVDTYGGNYRIDVGGNPVETGGFVGQPVQGGQGGGGH